MSEIITTPLGSINIIDFPKKAKTFKDFPNGRFIIKSEVGTSITLHYQLNVLSPSKLAQMRLDSRDNPNKLFALPEIKEAMKANSEGYQQAFLEGAKKYFLDNYRVILDNGNLSRLSKHLEWVVNPAAVKHTIGTVQLIHGTSAAGDGYNNFELYFPRYICFRMTRLRYEPSATKPDDLFGTVMFANKEYGFRLFPGRSMVWNEHGVERTRFFKDIMSKEDAEAEIRRYMYTWFPFIQEYDMLGEFKFN